jgi:hypothetical protein
VRGRLKTRMTLEGLAGLTSLVLAVLTVVNREWIEELTGLEPDAGSGALEWLIVIAFGLAAVLLGRMAWRDRQRLRTADA